MYSGNVSTFDAHCARSSARCGATIRTHMSTSAPRGSSSSRERRAEPRFEVELAATWRIETTSGAAVVRDMSASGARIESAGVRPAIGEGIDLSIRIYPGAVPVRVDGKVMRHTETGGFAVQFQSMKPRVRAQIASILPKIGKPV